MRRYLNYFDHYDICRISKSFEDQIKKEHIVRSYTIYLYIVMWNGADLTVTNKQASYFICISLEY